MLTRTNIEDIVSSLMWKAPESIHDKVDFYDYRIDLDDGNAVVLDGTIWFEITHYCEGDYYTPPLVHGHNMVEIDKSDFEYYNEDGDCYRHRELTDKEIERIKKTLEKK